MIAATGSETVAEKLLFLCLAAVVLSIGFLLFSRRERGPRDAAPEAGPTDLDLGASEKLTSLIDLLFALVLTLPVVLTSDQDVVRAPWHSNIPAVVALFISYYVVIRSFVDWHIAMQDAPYWIRTSSLKAWELRRVYVDFAIVILYVMLFLSTGALPTHAGTDISEFLLLLAAIIALYVIWGTLRHLVYETYHEFRFRILALAFVGFLAVWGAYRLDRVSVHWVTNNTTRNSLALALAASVLLAYRRRNWKEIRQADVVPAREASQR
jgi:hypothetical protein